MTRQRLELNRVTEHDQFGGKPWTYLLVPHDEVTASATLAGLVARFVRETGTR